MRTPLTRNPQTCSHSFFKCQVQEVTSVTPDDLGRDTPATKFDALLCITDGCHAHFDGALEMGDESAGEVEVGEIVGEVFAEDISNGLLADCRPHLTQANSVQLYTTSKASFCLRMTLTTAEEWGAKGHWDCCYPLTCSCQWSFQSIVAEMFSWESLSLMCCVWSTTFLVF